MTVSDKRLKALNKMSEIFGEIIYDKISAKKNAPKEEEKESAPEETEKEEEKPKTAPPKWFKNQPPPLKE